MISLHLVVKALYYNPGFETRQGELNFSTYLIFPAAVGLGVYSACNRNEYQKQKNNVSWEQRAAGAKGLQTYCNL
jgi:hypothetical protein